MRALCSGISFVDATFMAVCDNRRIQQHQVFKGIAARGKGSTGWSFGFKLHLVVSDRNDQLKNISQIEHSRHRSPINFLVNLVSGLIAYTHQVKKPSLDLAPFTPLEDLAYP